MLKTFLPSVHPSHAQTFWSQNFAGRWPWGGSCGTSETCWRFIWVRWCSSTSVASTVSWVCSHPTGFPLHALHSLSRENWPIEGQDCDSSVATAWLHNTLSMSLSEEIIIRRNCQIPYDLLFGSVGHPLPSWILGTVTSRQTKLNGHGWKSNHLPM